MNKVNFIASGRMASAILLALSSLPFSHAQSIRPVISEYTATVAKGSFELINTGLVPLTVVLDPRSFSVSEKGDITYRPLDKSIQLKLSAMSFQIPPEQSHFVFYEAHAEAQPAWFVIFSSIGALGKSATGMNIRVDLPHTVYILPKHVVEKSDLLIDSTGLTPDNGPSSFRVTNNGPWFGRILSVEFIRKDGTTQSSGFPIFPHSTRIVAVPCKDNQPGTVLRVRLRNFKIEEPLPVSAGNGPCAM